MRVLGTEDGMVLSFDNKMEINMNELKYLIFQSLIGLDLNLPRREIYTRVKDNLDKERVSYDKETINTLIEIGLSEIEESFN